MCWPKVVLRAGLCPFTLHQPRLVQTMHDHLHVFPLPRKTKRLRNMPVAAPSLSSSLSWKCNEDVECSFLSVQMESAQQQTCVWFCGLPLRRQRSYIVIDMCSDLLGFVVCSAASKWKATPIMEGRRVDVWTAVFVIEQGWHLLRMCEVMLSADDSLKICIYGVHVLALANLQ